MVSGNARILAVANTGAAAAQLLAIDPVVLPAGTTYVTNCGSTLAPGAMCTITITPGAVATAVPGALASTPVPVVIQGSNTNTGTADVHVLDYGSFYQGGHVFALDDTTAHSASVGGKVAASTGVMQPWSAGPAVFDVVGTTDTSTGPAPACNGKFDGACNTDLIVSAPLHVGVSLPTYAAGVCRSATLSTYADWYLPAICEMASGAVGCPSGETVQEKLADPGFAVFPESWSSTQSSQIGNPALFAWTHQFAPNAGSSNGFGFKTNPGAIAASCVRKLTP